MDFLKQLEPHTALIDAFDKGHGITDTVAINAIASIWDDFSKTKVKEIYGTAGFTPPPTNVGCASCIKDMMKLVVAWRRIEGQNSLVPFKGIPQSAPKANVIEVRVAPKVETIAPVTPKGQKADYSNMKFGELRGIAKKQGIKFSNKVSKQELIDLLSK